jgi:hypothetical protein
MKPRNLKPLTMKMTEINELLIEKNALETKGIDILNDEELDRYYIIKDRITELVGGNKDVQISVEQYLERRYGR